ncbi:hypothetical protein C9975_05850 [Thalassospira xiamenensis]|nr:hypothetical protein C9975_05850 [Thalassospira xiamenensis]
MRQLIIELGDVFRNQSNARLTDWVNTLYTRTVSSAQDGVMLSLHDINERLTSLAIGDISKQFELGFKAMKEQTLVLPVVDRRLDALQPIVELKSAFFKDLLESDTASIKIERTGVIRDGDVYELNGSDEFAVFDIAHENRGNDALAAVVNFTVDGQPQHVMLNATELENVKKAYINVKFGGLNPLTKEEWDDIFLACVFRRMFSDEAFSGAKSKLSEQVVEKWRDAILLHNKFFKRQAEADNLVRDRYGKVIGRTFRKYDAIAIAKTEQDEAHIPSMQKKQNVVCLEQKRTEKANQSNFIDSSGVPFDDMDFFEKALDGSLSIDVDEVFQSEATGLDDSFEDVFEEDEAWDV